MAEKISNRIFAIFKKEDLEKLNWINDKIEKGANAGAHTGYMHQSFSEGDITLGSISFTQAVISSTDLLGVTKSLGKTAERFITGASGLLDLAYVDIKIYRSLTDGKELTTYKNQLELSDGLTLLSGGITFTGALIGATTTLFPVAVALAVAGGAYYVYQTNSENEKITLDKFTDGYEKTAMNAFANAQWDAEDKVHYRLLNVSQGGAQTLRWVIGAIEGEQVVNPTSNRITQITPNNYGQMSLDYTYSEGAFEGNVGLRTQTGDKILNEYHLKFIYDYPALIFRNLREWKKTGKADIVSAYIHALEQLNPVVVVNPKNPVQAKRIADVGEDWIKLRTWLVMEYLLNTAIQRHGDVGNNLSDVINRINTDSPIAEQIYKSLIQRVQTIRSEYGIDIDAPLEVRDLLSNQSFMQHSNEAREAHQLTFAGDQIDIEISGSSRHDVLVGRSKSDTLLGREGNDFLFGGKGDDHLKGGSGRNLLNGGEGRDFYYFDTADGDFDDTIIDSDGKGKIIIDGESLLGHFFDPKAGAVNVWTAKIGAYDWQAVLTDSGDLILHTLQGNHRISIPGWKAMGDRGLEIILREYNSTINSSVNMTLLGDWRTRIMGEEYIPDDVDRKHYGKYDWNHWYKRNPDGAIDTPYGVAEKDFDDVINGMRTKVNKLKIDGFGGDDALGGSEGNDYIYGGEGRDLIVGAGGKDLLDGGAGDDFIFSNYRLYASERLLPDERWKMPDNGIEEKFAGRTWGVYKTSAGHWRVSGIYQQTDDAGDEGDSLFGGSGNDWIYGSNLGDYIYGDRNFDRSLPGISQHGNDEIYGLGGNDQIEGNGGDDTIFGDGFIDVNFMEYVNPKNHGDDILAGGYGDDHIFGGGNNDTIFGDDGNDYLYGDQGFGDFSASQLDYLPNEFQGIDTIRGGAGHDRIMGGGNDDYLYGGLGNDQIWGDYGNHEAAKRAFGDDEIWGDEGEDTLHGGYGTDTIHGGAHDDRIWGGAGTDFLYGDAGNDIMIGDGDFSPAGQEATDYMDGGDGNDIMFGGGGGEDTLRGGTGNDQMYGNTSENTGADGINYLYGNEGEDKLWGAGNTDHIFGGEDNDQITGYAGDDQLYGEEGDDRIYGDESQSSWRNPYTITGEDRIFGGAGNDYLDGGNGDDKVYGDEGNDIVLGYFGDDYLSGGDGNDDVAGGAGDDYVYGDDGNDIVRGDWPVASLDADPNAGGADHLFGGRGDDQMDGGYGDDELHGDEGNDLLYANAGNDMLFGGEGNDELNAVSGTNRLFGDEGNDILRSGAGNDYLNGGLGNDVYYFKRDFGHDVIDNNDRLKDRFDYIHFLETRRDEVEILREYDNLVIRTLDGAHQVTVFRHFSEVEPWHFINAIRFADDDRWYPPHYLVNHPPEVVQPLANLAVKADSDIGGQITLDAISDPDGETLVYQLTLSDGIALPEWLQFDAQTGAISGHAPADSSLLHLRLTGTDHAGESAFTDFTLQVNAAPKVAHSLEPHRAVEGQDFSFQLPSDTFVDPESDPLNLQLLQGNGETLPDWLHFDAASGTVSGHAPVGAPDLSLSLIATDPLGNQAHADFSLALTEPPQSVKTSWRGGTVHGKDGDDQLIGSNFNDRLFGEDGNDYLKAKFGNDVLDGGRGDDRMEGDWGNDEYHYRAGDGHDTIHDSHGKDTLILDGIRQGDTHFLLRGNDLVLEFAHDGGSVVIENHTGHGRIEHFRFADVNLDHHAVDDLLRQLGNHQHGVM